MIRRVDCKLLLCSNNTLKADDVEFNFKHSSQDLFMNLAEYLFFRDVKTRYYLMRTLTDIYYYF